MPCLDLATRCEALFVTDLTSRRQPEARQVRSAIMRTIQRFGAQHCAAQVAQEFGDHPETAIARMRWAREAVFRTYYLATCPRRSPAGPPRVRAMAGG
jgi:hypothetical protein